MTERTFIVRFRPPETRVQPVHAASGEVVDDYLVFLRDDGSVAAFFLNEVIEEWSVAENSK